MRLALCVLFCIAFVPGVELLLRLKHIVSPVVRMSLPKLKILCLHGKTQNKEVFRTKLGRIPHKLRHVAELTIIDAPHILEADSSPESTARTWFYRHPETNYVNVDSLLHTFRELQQTWKELGPFDGILGFSMGGTIASFMAGSVGDRDALCCDDRFAVTDSNRADSLFPGLKFVVCAGAVDIHPQLESVIAELGLPLRHPFKIPAEVQSLHITGTADTSVPIQSSLALSQRFTDAQFIEHDQGHHIPSKAHVVGGIVEFVTSQYKRLSEN
jgi:alpha/beta superfamily hydrolase